MSVRKNLQAIYTRFPPEPPTHHPLYLADTGDVHLVIIKDNQYYPFIVPESSWRISPADFVKMIEAAADEAGILDILDGKA